MEPSALLASQDTEKLSEIQPDVVLKATLLLKSHVEGINRSSTGMFTGSLPLPSFGSTTGAMIWTCFMRRYEPEPVPVAAAAVGAAPALWDDFASGLAAGRGALGEIQLTDAIGALARAGRPVFGVRLEPEQCRLDIGNLESYFRAFDLLKEEGRA